MFVCFLLVAVSPMEETNYLLTKQGPKSGRSPGPPARQREPESHIRVGGDNSGRVEAAQGCGIKIILVPHGLLKRLCLSQQRGTRWERRTEKLLCHCKILLKLTQSSKLSLDEALGSLGKDDAASGSRVYQSQCVVFKTNIL